MTTSFASSTVPTLARRVWAALLTGIPFAVFKIGGGLAAAVDVHPAVGGAFVVWGVVDIALNIVSVGLPEHVAYCALANLGRRLDRRRGRAGVEQVLLAVDTLLAGGIVATMIALHRTQTLSPIAVLIWEWAVILSVLGAGAERVWDAFRRLDAAPTSESVHFRSAAT